MWLKITAHQSVPPQIPRASPVAPAPAPSHGGDYRGIVRDRGHPQGGPHQPQDRGGEETRFYVTPARHKYSRARTPAHITDIPLDSEHDVNTAHTRRGKHATAARLPISFHSFSARPTIEARIYRSIPGKRPTLTRVCYSREGRLHNLRRKWARDATLETFAAIGDLNITVGWMKISEPTLTCASTCLEGTLHVRPCNTYTNTGHTHITMNSLNMNNAHLGTHVLSTLQRNRADVFIVQCALYFKLPTRKQHRCRRFTSFCNQHVLI